MLDTFLLAVAEGGGAGGGGLFDGIGFDPFFRGLLSVIAISIALIGSTYLIVATNTGTRSGALISAAGLFGWMFLMGIVWTIYGIGWRGDAPTWTLREINVDDIEDADDGLLFSEIEEAIALYESSADGMPAGGLAEAQVNTAAVVERFENADNLTAVERAMSQANTVGDVPDVDVAQAAALVASRDLDLGEWRYLLSSDAVRGEAQASADAILVEEGVFEAGGYVPEQFGAFIIDGKPILDENANQFDRVVHFFNETVLNPFFDEELVVVQVRGAIPQVTLPGQAPPVATVDQTAPLVSVIMERDRGGPIPSLFSGLRFTPAMFTLFNGLVFAALAWNLHVRDQREAKIREAASA
ncbi:MAG: hypothetical protein AAF467_04925 [Actinomycetota bacterium]